MTYSRFMFYLSVRPSLARHGAICWYLNRALSYNANTYSSTLGFSGFNYLKLNFFGRRSVLCLSVTQQEATKTDKDVDRWTYRQTANGFGVLCNLLQVFTNLSHCSWFKVRHD